MDRITHRDALIWMAFSGVSPAKAFVILGKNTATEVYERLPDSPSLKEVLNDCYASLLKNRDIDIIRNYIAKLHTKGIGIITLYDDEYPNELKQKEVVPPIILYFRGNLDVLKNERIAIVGTRKCTYLGGENSKLFANGFAQNGITVVSGLAQGIDSFAHEQAIDSGGSTVAVLGYGHESMPVYAHRLYKKILDKGSLILSEYPCDYQATMYSYPQRNRIISGLSKAVIVVEADIKSGALITANFAADQSREVFAVPGAISSKQSLGTNKLIQCGAALALSPEEVLSELSIKATDSQKSKGSVPLKLDIFETAIYDILSIEPTSFDRLVEKTGYLPHNLSTILFDLESRGIVAKLPANIFKLK